ncbi:MAG TPA: thioredoxin domain-containing protein [Candidatus Angelobacter sp.]|nr:thioredoxin domain-containing protein [Candidatus Angelobacter sp.]
MRVRLTAGALACVFAAGVVAMAESFASLLPPPPGAKVAIVVFQDLQWPDCAIAYPLLVEAARAHNVPLVVHDFPLPRHNWSFQAAVNARFFDQESPQLGDEFRGYILQNQKQIMDETALQRFTSEFAAERQVELPVVLDPDGKLAQMVTADFRLGQRIGLEHTPTVFVVSAGQQAYPMVETIDRQKLDRVIEELQKKAGPPVTAKRTLKKKKHS